MVYQQGQGVVQARMSLDGMTSLSRPSTAAAPSGSFMNMDQVCVDRARLFVAAKLLASAALQMLAALFATRASTS